MKNSKSNHNLQIRNKWESVFSVLLTLVAFITLAVVLQIIFKNFFSTTAFYTNLYSHPQLSYYIWSVQATVSVLCFFITNVITTIVKDTVFGVNIKDLLQAKANFFEISFWHQSMVCILLVLFNGVFVIFDWLVAMIVVVTLNVIFVIYMLHSAFEIVFSAELLQKRAKKIIYKEINTGKTILDLEQVINSLELTIIHNIDAKEQKQLSNNLDFLIGLYHTFNVCSRANEKASCLSSIINVGCKLVGSNNFDYIEKNIIPKISVENSDDLFLLLQKLSKKMVNHFISFTDADAVELNILNILLNWSTYVNNKANTNFFSNVLLEYYTNIKINLNLSSAIKYSLTKDLFHKIIYKVNKNQIQDDFKKITVLKFVKATLINPKEFEDVSNIISQIYSYYATHKDETKELIIHIIAYLNFASQQSIYGENLLERTKQFMCVRPQVLSGYSENLNTHLKTSNGKYLIYFWKILKLYQDYNLQTDLSLGNNENLLDSVLGFFMDYWKLNCNNLINIDFKDLYKQPNYSVILEKLIQVLKKHQENEASLNLFCNWLDINIEELKADETWVSNTKKIIEYLNDIYLNDILNTTKIQNKKLKLMGTSHFEKTVVANMNTRVEKLPFTNKKTTATEKPRVATFNMIIKNIELINTNSFTTLITECAKKFKDHFAELFSKVLETELKTHEIPFNLKKDKITNLIKNFDKFKIDSFTHYLSNNLEFVNAYSEEDLKPLVLKEQQFNMLEELQNNKYYYLNAKNIQIFVRAQKAQLTKLDDKSIKHILGSLKKGKNAYTVENIETSLENATEYISNSYSIITLEYHYLINFAKDCGFILNINKK